MLKDLRGMIGCSAIDAEKLLQLSYLIYKRFIAGDEVESIEHHAIAMWCGQILFSNQDDYAESDWVHEDVPEDDGDAVDDLIEDGDHSRVAEDEDGMDAGHEEQDSRTGNDANEVVPESDFTEDEAERVHFERLGHLDAVEREVEAALARPGADAEEIRRRVVAALQTAPSDNKVPTPAFRVSKSAVRSSIIPATSSVTRAMSNLSLLSTPVAPPAVRGSRDFTSGESNSALERIIETLRKKLSKADAEDVINSLATMNDGLRYGNYAGEAPPPVNDVRSLGRSRK